jgi:hypothetical protein
MACFKKHKKTRGLPFGTQKRNSEIY